jgi:uncharacterized repeat protein (TIGR01451 family)
MHAELRRSHRRFLSCAAIGAAGLTLLLSWVSPVKAASGPHWSITSTSEPTNLAPGETLDEYRIVATNTGGITTNGSTITMTDVLPTAVTLAGVSGFEGISRSPMSCQPISCTYSGPVVAGGSLIMLVHVEVPANAPAATVTNIATVSGGGGLEEAFASDPTTISAEKPSFGLAAGGPQVSLSTNRAGAHPDVTTSIAFNSLINPDREEFFSYQPVQAPKDLNVSLPPGLVGNPNAIGRCSSNQLGLGGGVGFGGCPTDSQVGLVTLDLGSNSLPVVYPVYNMIPQPGEPAELGFYAYVAPVYIPVHVRSDGDYGVTASLTNLVQAPLPVLGSVLTLWGIPGDPSHNAGRLTSGTFNYGASSGLPPQAFMSNPTACQAEALMMDVSADSWQAPGLFIAPATASFGRISGCDQLAFRPSIEIQPDTLQAQAPTGYTVDLEVPQSDDPASLATPTLRDASVALPAGTVVSPGAADGLQACSDEQFGLHSETPASCPQASQIGTVLGHTPLLSSPVEGKLFLGQPNCGPCGPSDAASGKMVRLFLEVEGSGVIVKLEGKDSIGQGTGSLTTTFAKDPQLTFSDLKLTLKGGPRAPLANPTTCGPATTTTDLTPWSSPFTPDATPSSSFTVEGCGPAQFHPVFSAGTTSNQAGEFSPFTLTLTRSDQEQDIQRLTVRTPPGLLGMLSKVQLCEEPQAAQGTCPAASQVGHVTVGAGPGSNPLYVPQAGKPQDPVYLTGPYNGAPFGLSIVVPAEAGPFNLGTVVVRSAINVDPRTAQITIASDPLPTNLDGIPLHVRTVNVTVDREGFMFNPTNCEPLSLTGGVASDEGMGSVLSTHFQAANCATLPFHPSFTASTQGRASHANGVSLDVKVGYPKGTQANIRSVKVSLPKQLPSRLTTLQKACPEATFAANPAACPTASDVGTVTATTPVLNVPLTGPAYLVSHGGVAFPDLVVVLQGQGITLDLVGGIGIHKVITTSTFASVPDAPISSFELKLPEGPHSALTSNLPAKSKGSFCSTKLSMPTTIVGQNGARITQSTKVAVTGCPKARKARARTRRRRS